MCSKFSLWLILILPGFALSSFIVGEPMTKADNDRQLSLQQDNPIAAFDAWMRKFNRHYVKGSHEWRRRYEIWANNLDKAVHYNQRQRTHWLTMTGLADLEPEEVDKHFTGLLLPEPRLRSQSPKASAVDLTQVPRKVDWRKRGAVTPVKDQALCGACWAFSAVGSMEGLHALTTGELVSLSEQELIDCDSLDNGCDGGHMNTAFDWTAQNGGITTARDYKYNASRNACNTRKLPHATVSIAGFHRVPGTEAHLIHALAEQPVSVAVNGELLSFFLYGGGIYDVDCDTKLTHAMLAVGYDLDAGYVLLKNSWGEYWGEGGYIRLSLNKNDGNGQCGVALLVSYPVLETEESPESSSEPTDDDEPEPDSVIQCGSRAYCRRGESCCCMSQVWSICYEWGCCPQESSICCSDSHYCCPKEYPICGRVPGTCLNRVNSIEALQRRRAAAQRSSRPRRMMHPIV